MSTTGKRALERFARKWQWLHYTELLLVSAGLFLGLLFMAIPIWWSLLVFLLFFILLIIKRSPWHYTPELSASYVDTKIPETHWSTELVLKPVSEVSGLGRLQRQRLDGVLGERLPKLQPPHQIFRAMGLLLLLAVLGWGLGQTPWFSKLSPTELPGDEQIQFTPVLGDTLGTIEAPQLIEQSISLVYPKYTALPPRRQNSPNITALAGTRVVWELQFDGAIDSVYFENNAGRIQFDKIRDRYTLQMTMAESSFYNFRFIGKGGEQRTDLYALRVLKDSLPEVTVMDSPRYRYFDVGDTKDFELKVSLRDDFGIASANIIATVSKGSGESVKFREERLAFPSFQKGLKRQMVQRGIDLDSLGMDVGDELYFYIEVLDNRRPQQQLARSETYFALIKDTITDNFAVEGGMGVDLMPAYFRSQRQLIIDTEKLLAQKGALSKETFNRRSMIWDMTRNHCD